MLSSDPLVRLGLRFLMLWRKLHDITKTHLGSRRHLAQLEPRHFLQSTPTGKGLQFPKRWGHIRTYNIVNSKDLFSREAQVLPRSLPYLVLSNTPPVTSGFRLGSSGGETPRQKSCGLWFVRWARKYSTVPLQGFRFYRCCVCSALLLFLQACKQACNRAGQTPDETVRNDLVFYYSWR